MAVGGRALAGHVDRVRAGRCLTPPVWPGGARAAVALSFDSDHETSPLRDGETSPGRSWLKASSARASAFRESLRLLADTGVAATFFIPAVSALLHPGEARGYVDAGHEVGVHGWIHERNALLSLTTSASWHSAALDCPREECGVRPRGDPHTVVGLQRQHARDHS